MPKPFNENIFYPLKRGNFQGNSGQDSQADMNALTEFPPSPG